MTGSSCYPEPEKERCHRMMRGRTWKRLFLSLLAGLLLFPGGSPLPAADNPQWQRQPFSFYAREIALEDLLLDFSGNLSVPVVLSEQAKRQRVSGKFTRLSGLEFIDLLSRSHNLAWFFDGATLFVRHVNEVAREEIALDTAAFDTAAFVATYESFAIGGNFNRWDIIFDGRVMRLRGLPEYVGFVRKIINFISGDEAAMQDAVGSNGDRTVVRMLKVRHAYNEEQLVNLANILAKAMGVPRIDLLADLPAPGAGATGTAGGKEDTAAAGGGILGGLFGQGLSSKNVEPIETMGTAPGAAPPAPDPGAAETTAEAAAPAQPGSIVHFVSVNTQMRSIIVRDLLSRIPRYRQLLQEVDAPQRQIEISASILDINSNFNSNLGINIQDNQAEGLLEYTYTPSVINDIGTFRARLFALVKDGSARFVTEPSVLTLNNRPAQFKTDQTFYVRLTGDRAVDLIPINFGTLLQVTPNIVGDLMNAGGEPQENAKIHLAIHIEDGVRSASATPIDEIPPVNNTVIDTEALVEQGASLLIGGYQVNNETEGSAGIPVLKDIPVLGLLFSTRSKTSTLNTRYFVITTRIVDYETPEDVQREDEKASASLSS